MIGYCKNCGQKSELRGALCENCRLEIDGKRQQEILGTGKKKQTKEEIEEELAERRRDKSQWWG
ncbi:MAG: hypothetical protein ABH854_01605 [Candidatus Diapherotrites archaeon]|nr:hypothetical protein [Candidatus Micrarchaeota archaeon]MBU1939260.1 hypothetical protein [Candidatus Micrarchaeota archaeon]